MMAWIDTMIDKLNQEQNSDTKIEVSLAKLIEGDMALLSKSIGMLKAESEHLAYFQLREEIKDLIKAKEKYIKLMESVLLKWGEKLTPEDVSETGFFAQGDFYAILNLETRLQGQLNDHANLAEDKGYKWIAEELRFIRDENYKFLDHIDRIIMRINAEI